MGDSNNSSASVSVRTATAMATAHRPAKSAAAFRTISEVAGDLDVAQHVLRFWESKFPQVRPLKRGGGRRYYRPEDVELLRTIRSLLYEEGYTIKGAQKLLKGSRRYPEGDPGPHLDEADPDERPRQVARAPAAVAAPQQQQAPAPGAPKLAAVRSPEPSGGAPSPAAVRGRLEHLRDELVSIRDILRRTAAE